MGTWRASDPLLCNNSASTITTSTISTMGWLVASAFLHGLSTASRACPSPPCCPSIIRIFSPHLLDTCMNEEIDKIKTCNIPKKKKHAKFKKKKKKKKKKK